MTDDSKTDDPKTEVTRWLRAWEEGERGAEERLLSLIYDELRRMADRYLRHERSGHTLEPTALVHEAYLRLVDQDDLRWQSRSHFFGIAARTMRRILVEHARRRRSAKRGGGRPPVPLEKVGDLAAERPADLVAIDEALRGLAEVDATKASLVELRFFGGLSIEETAQVLGCSRTTVIRGWRVAKAWLYHELLGEHDRGDRV
jgi:RNA polymerase sigma factor (TIGR02999 family)